MGSWRSWAVTPSKSSPVRIVPMATTLMWPTTAGSSTSAILNWMNLLAGFSGKIISPSSAATRPCLARSPSPAPTWRRLRPATKPSLSTTFPTLILARFRSRPTNPSSQNNVAFHSYARYGQKLTLCEMKSVSFQMKLSILSRFLFGSSQLRLLG